MHVLLNDVPVDPIVRRGSRHFPLEIGFYAGGLSVAVVQGRTLLGGLDIDVDPELSKITREEYAALISDIARSTLSLYRLGGLTVPAEVDPTAIRADLVTLDLVRSNLELFERAISRIADQPSRRLESTLIQVDTLKARRIEDRAITWALRSGKSRTATAAELRAAPRLVGALGGEWIPRIAERHRAERVDLYENRALLGFLRWLDGTLASVANRLSNDQTGILPAVAVAWTDRIQSWRRRIARLSRRDVFVGLTPDPSLRATSIFRLHPDYATAFSAMVRMKAGLGTGSAVTPFVPIDRTFALYETWCYVGLLNAAAEAFPSSRPKVASLLSGLSAPNQLGTYLASGEASAVNLGDGFTLTYQRRFGPKADASGCRTSLIEAVPDVTIARSSSSGACEGIVVLDPKYRRGSSLLDGLRDLHVYRDAILGPDDRRIVSSAIAIAPRPFGEATPDVAPTSVAPGFATARPGHDPGVFERLLRSAVQTLS